MTATKLISKLVRDEQGTSAVELGLILAMIVLAMFAALKGFSAENNRTWTNIADKTREAIASGTNNQPIT